MSLNTETVVVSHAIDSPERQKSSRTFAEELGDQRSREVTEKEFVLHAEEELIK